MVLMNSPDSRVFDSWDADTVKSLCTCLACFIIPEVLPPVVFMTAGPFKDFAKSLLLGSKNSQTFDFLDIFYVKNLDNVTQLAKYEYGLIY